MEKKTKEIIKAENHLLIKFIKDKDRVEPGTILTNGAVYPQDILKTKGIKGVQDYILRETQNVYRSQGVDINDKHVEIIIRQICIGLVFHLVEYLYLLGFLLVPFSSFDE